MWDLPCSTILSVSCRACWNLLISLISELQFFQSREDSMICTSLFTEERIPSRRSKSSATCALLADRKGSSNVLLSSSSLFKQGRTFIKYSSWYWWNSLSFWKCEWVFLWTSTFSILSSASASSVLFSWRSSNRKKLKGNFSQWA